MEIAAAKAGLRNGTVRAIKNSVGLIDAAQPMQPRTKNEVEEKLRELNEEVCRSCRGPTGAKQHF